MALIQEINEVKQLLEAEEWEEANQKYIELFPKINVMGRNEDREPEWRLFHEVLDLYEAHSEEINAVYQKDNQEAFQQDVSSMTLEEQRDYFSRLIDEGAYKEAAAVHTDVTLRMMAQYEDLGDGEKAVIRDLMNLYEEHKVEIQEACSFTLEDLDWKALESGEEAMETLDFGVLDSDEDVDHVDPVSYENFKWEMEHVHAEYLEDLSEDERSRLDWWRPQFEDFQESFNHSYLHDFFRANIEGLESYDSKEAYRALVVYAGRKGEINDTYQSMLNAQLEASEVETTNIGPSRSSGDIVRQEDLDE